MLTGVGLPKSTHQQQQQQQGQLQSPVLLERYHQLGGRPSAVTGMK